MNKLLLTSIALSLAASSLALEYEPTWRWAENAPIPRLHISAYAVDDYSHFTGGSATTLSNRVRTKNAFIQYIEESANRAYPNMPTPIHGYMYNNSGATKANFKGAQLYHSNIVFFAGHGAQQTLAFYDQPMAVSQKPYGGDIKWVFYDACEVLNINQDDKLEVPLYSKPTPMDDNKLMNLYGAFIGVHAILGYYSLGRDDPSYTSNGVRVYQHVKYKYFAEYFIENDFTLWEAYYWAHNRTFNEFDQVWVNSGAGHIPGFTPAIAFMAGTDQYGRYHDGSAEKFSSTYEVGLDPRKEGTNYSMYILYQEFGTPEYYPED